METNYKQKIILTDRKILSIEGIKHVGSFDENEIILETNMGFISLKGNNLHITQLNLDEGSLMVEGFIESLNYVEEMTKNLRSKGRSIMQRMFK